MNKEWFWTVLFGFFFWGNHFSSSVMAQAGKEGGEWVSIPKAEYEEWRKYRSEHVKEEGKGLSQVLYRFQTPWGMVGITGWKLIGWMAAFLFSGRWLVQMYYSRKAGRPVMPRSYWVISVVASLMLLAYFTLSPQRGSVGVLQNLFPAFVAAYNLYLDFRFQEDRKEAIAGGSMERALPVPGRGSS